MVDRQEVERWLSVCTVAGHDTPDGDNSHASFEVSAPTLAALCRAWLAVQDAQTAEVTWDAGSYAYLVFDGGPEEMRGWRWNAHMAEQLDGQRVRIVKEVG